MYVAYCLSTWMLHRAAGRLWWVWQLTAVFIFICMGGVWGWGAAAGGQSFPLLIFSLSLTHTSVITDITRKPITAQCATLRKLKTCNTQTLRRDPERGGDVLFPADQLSDSGLSVIGCDFKNFIKLFFPPAKKYVIHFIWSGGDVNIHFYSVCTRWKMIQMFLVLRDLDMIQSSCALKHVMKWNVISNTSFTWCLYETILDPKKWAITTIIVYALTSTTW